MRAAVLGGGYAGVALARRLAGSLDDDAELVVVDETGTHLVQHELHRVIRRPALAEALRIPLTDLVGDARIVEDRVEALDPDAGTVELADGEGLSYEAGALALGAETAFHGLPGVREHGMPLKSVGDALAIRASFLSVCADDGHAVVGGAGLSGVQAAGELVALAGEVDADPTVTLLEQASQVAPRFDPSFGTAVRTALEAAGVDVRLGTAVAGADEETLELEDGESVLYDQLVWTGGVRGPAAVGGERPAVRSDLRVGERTVGLGDAVDVVDANGEPVPASAQAAVRQAPVAATNLRRLLAGGDAVFEPRLERFTFESPGWLVSVGDGAVGQVGPAVVTGATARAMKATVGANYFTSVGAIQRATDVVYEELGLGDVEPPADLEWPGDGQGGSDEFDHGGDDEPADTRNDGSADNRHDESADRGDDTGGTDDTGSDEGAA